MMLSGTEDILLFSISKLLRDCSLLRSEGISDIWFSDRERSQKWAVIFSWNSGNSVSSLWLASRDPNEVQSMRGGSEVSLLQLMLRVVKLVSLPTSDGKETNWLLDKSRTLSFVKRLMDEDMLSSLLFWQTREIKWVRSKTSTGKVVSWLLLILSKFMSGTFFNPSFNSWSWLSISEPDRDNSLPFFSMTLLIASIFKSKISYSRSYISEKFNKIYLVN